MKFLWKCTFRESDCDETHLLFVCHGSLYILDAHPCDSCMKTCHIQRKYLQRDVYYSSVVIFKSGNNLPYGPRERI